MAFLINQQLVGDDVIEEEFDSIKQFYQERGEVVCCDRDVEFRSYACENVLNRTLMVQESEKRFGPMEPEKVTARLAEMVAEHGGEDSFYENTGYSASDTDRIRAKIAISLAVDRLAGELLGADPDPTEDDLKAYFERNIENYLTAEEVKVAHLMKEPKSHQEAVSCFQDLKAARERLLNGEDFDTVAMEVAQKSPEETDLGWMKQGETMPEIESVVFSMRLGEISPVIATHFGFHVLKVVDRKEKAPMPFEPLRDQLRESFLTDRREGIVNEFLTGVKSRSSIEEIEPEH